MSESNSIDKKDVIVAIPNDIQLAQSIGKKGTENGVVFYNRKTQDTDIVVLTPSDPIEKYYAVAESIILSDIVIISTKKIDALLGECLIACQLLGKKVAITDEMDIQNITKGMSLNFDIIKSEELLNYKT